MASANTSLPTERAIPLSKRELRALRGGFTLFIISMIIPFLVLINVRYIMADSYVSPEANQMIGLSAAIVMLISAGIARAGFVAARKDNQANVQLSLAYAMATGIIGLVLVFVQLVDGSVNPVSHFGEVFLIILGTVAFYLICGILTLFSAYRRVRMHGVGGLNYWGVESAAHFWMFVSLAWIVMYVVMYLI
ncbi:hypothetical protein LSG31_18440 [Fodinisporobacter ferrooxydans]|uniref:Heme-copper oxidase subunit III family profile domain-containing protein n=1 Tax=Fodinisporobacter ferrooxydans TaxID=2901836 RepID=A0ABY4CH37_9BACL|nr:hypothetical protein LSG31_18440 [Alicyclobacillaceae bacterium MYW30-H2]